ncbi:unnamed protein product [Prorocentrum cordatum]|uniref:Uncharacterized protein n=1 Tax=Prorocentrum cordatum TaxID=2364126 RepID=A0ABN9WR32_9DINO|nr:unnamed protein product [Polarella glacialis]
MSQDVEAEAGRNLLGEGEKDDNGDDEEASGQEVAEEAELERHCVAETEAMSQARRQAAEEEDVGQKNNDVTEQCPKVESSAERHRVEEEQEDKAKPEKVPEQPRPAGGEADAEQRDNGEGAEKERKEEHAVGPCSEMEGERALTREPPEHWENVSRASKLEHLEGLGDGAKASPAPAETESPGPAEGEQECHVGLGDVATGSPAPAEEELERREGATGVTRESTAVVAGEEAAAACREGGDEEEEEALPRRG